MVTPTPLIYLMGPTASGKTELAVELIRQFPLEIISVDSAMVYRGMDIGTAKPNQELLQIAPHHLINIADPHDIYSAGQFYHDAWRIIQDITARGRVPLLVGGTMLYFRVLQHGIAELPQANPQLRAELQARIAAEGLSSLYVELAQVDKEAALRIAAQDTQRIQRALEVYYLTGKNISTWQKEAATVWHQYRIHPLALIPRQRANLHQRIAERFQQMLKLGFLSEVEKLYARGDLSPALPSIKSVGYRQAWSHLERKISYADMSEQAIAATRQLAKRQLTWLRSWPGLFTVDMEAKLEGQRLACEWMKQALGDSFF